MVDDCDYSIFRKDLVKVADLICSKLTKEQLDCLSTASVYTFPFKEQILVRFQNKFFKVPEDEIEKWVDYILKDFQPFWKLINDDCQLFKVLISRLGEALFSDKPYEKPWTPLDYFKASEQDKPFWKRRYSFLGRLIYR